VDEVSELRLDRFLPQGSSRFFARLADDALHPVGLQKFAPAMPPSREAAGTGFGQQCFDEASEVGRKTLPMDVRP